MKQTFLKQLMQVFLPTLFLATGSALHAAGTIPEPKFGQYTVGDDYFLANYTQLIEYWDKLAAVSDRIKIVEIGKTQEGRSLKIAIITSHENHKNLKRYQEISVRLAKAEGLTDEQAHELATEGKAVVWIDGGLHATESVNAQALFLEAYDLVSNDDPETLRILENVILLLVPANPDGMDLVSDWYMKESDPHKRNMAIPRLYQKYAGHDNNRDSYIANLRETEVINRQMYIEWIPQIMWNQHQSGPAGTVLFMAPFRDPFNYNHDPLVFMGIDLVGTAVHNRFLAEGKAGAVLRNAASYSTWFNGGDRTTVGFHNQIGLLSEIIGNPTPSNIPLLPSQLLAGGDRPFPIGPRQEWHIRQSLDYILSGQRAILDIAAKLREDFLYRIYQMGKNSIERGSQDYWTLTPKRIAELEANHAKYREEQRKINRDSDPSFNERTSGNSSIAADYFSRGIPYEFWEKLHTPETRDPRGYIIPSNQPDFLTAVKFVNALLKTGVDVHRATGNFTVAGKSYPAGSYVVKAAQAFRPHLRDMFEPQDHPNDFQYPGGPPKPPYDVAGYTLAFQMGVKFDRILDGFDGPFEKVSGLLKPPAGKIAGASQATGYLLSHRVNDFFVATTRLLKSGEEIYWLAAPFTANGKTWPEGSIYIPAKSSTGAILQDLANEVGLNFDAISAKPKGDALKLRSVRVGLWDRYGGSMDSGWIRWLFEQSFPFPFDLVYAPELDAGDLKKKYDVLIFPDGAIPQIGGRGGRNAFRVNRDSVPDEYKNRIGDITADKTIPQLRKFAEEGGVLIAIGSSTELAYHFDLPITDALSEIAPDGSRKKFSSDKFYIPGSVLQVRVDTTTPIAYGVTEDIDILYRNKPVFRLLPDAHLKGVNVVAWFSGTDPLRSGWAWGQHYLYGGAAIVEAAVGKGKVFLFGPEITFRAQPHGTFKFLFNSIYYAGAKEVKL
ncbi:MAG: hypothetical protein LBE71_03295 [Dysgonamonadaceae bacterium]|jgi:hypothetical protein|nr:hypothetical protein [Dysgonamonadaceae bacterium]